MADAGTDILMKAINKGKPIPAESRVGFASGAVSDPLRTGFDPGAFCELEQLDFAVGAKSSVLDGKRGQGARMTHASRTSRSGLPEMIDMHPVGYNRILDTASTLLLQALTACETLDSISIVKRKAAGTRNAGEIYLRLDFEKVLMTNLIWNDTGAVVIETGTFIYRELQVRYRRQNSDGSLGAVVPANWKMKS